MSRARDNDLYAWGGHYDVDRPYTANGLNQLTTSGAANLGFDALGNLTSDGSNTYSYDRENRLIGVSGARSASLIYDPLGRLYEVTSPSTGTTRFLHDSDALVAEYNASGTLLRRYVHGPGADEPLIWYEGANPAWPNELRVLGADHQGSVVSIADGAGTAIGINSYDEYGIPAAGNSGRFQYTGQAWLAELGLYYYKARMYSPTLGRFMQTDPIGYGDGMNWYNYVGGDPVNFTDPRGTDKEAVKEIDDADKVPEYVITGRRLGSGGGFSGTGLGNWPGIRNPLYQPLLPVGEFTPGEDSPRTLDQCKSPAVQAALKHPNYRSMLRNAWRMSREKGNIEVGFNFGRYLTGEIGFGDVYPGRNSNTIIFRDGINSLVTDGMWSPNVHFHLHPAGEDPETSTFDGQFARYTNAMVVAIAPNGIDCTNGHR